MAGWTDYNLSDGVFKNKLLGSTCEALRLAIVERCQASNTTIPDSLQNEISTNSIPSKTWRNDFQSTISTLIPKFTNHTNNSGNWQGQTSIPAWTEADILTAIEAESRILAPDFFNAAWAEQQYKILNLLRWILKDVSYTERYRRSVSADNLDSVNDILSYWNDAEWIEQIGLSIGFNEYAGYVNDTWHPGKYIVSADRLKAKYNLNFTWTGAIPVDLYFIANAPYNFGQIYFIEEDAGVPYQTYKRYLTDTEISFNGLTLITEIGNIDSIPPRYSEEGAYKGWGDDGTGKVLLKFTDSNGFQFKDW